MLLRKPSHWGRVSCSSKRLGNRLLFSGCVHENQLHHRHLPVKHQGNHQLVDCEAVEAYYGVKTENGPVFNDVTDKPNVTKNEDGTVKSFRISYPTRLTMTWEKLPSPVKPASGGEEQGADPSLYYIGLGSVIFINEKGYKIVEIRDDTYVVVTFDALPDEDVQDLDALYASLFTPEQQTEIKNLGQLLDDEDVTLIFGKPGNHPVFEIPKDLVG